MNDSKERIVNHFKGFGLTDKEIEDKINEVAEIVFQESVSAKNIDSSTMRNILIKVGNVMTVQCMPPLNNLRLCMIEHVLNRFKGE